MTDSSPGPAARPLSPHLQVWRWHITMACSILHRATGVALYAGALILAGWTVALASGPQAFITFRSILGTTAGKLVMFALTVSVFYHLASGVRHLAWDIGRGFQPRTADMSGVVSVTFAIVSAVLVWAIAGLLGGL